MTRWLSSTVRREPEAQQNAVSSRNHFGIRVACGRVSSRPGVCEILRGLASILTVGVLVGTYSSIFVASPFAASREQHFGPEASQPPQGVQGAQRAAFD